MTCFFDKKGKRCEAMTVSDKQKAKRCKDCFAKCDEEEAIERYLDIANTNNYKNNSYMQEEFKAIFGMTVFEFIDKHDGGNA